MGGRKKNLPEEIKSGEKERERRRREKEVIHDPIKAQPRNKGNRGKERKRQKKKKKKKSWSKNSLKA